MRESLQPTKLAVIAAAAFGLTTVVSRGPTIALMVVGTLGLGLAIVSRPTGEEPDLGRWLFGAISVFAVMSLVGPAHDVIGSPPAWIFLVSGLTWLGLAIGWLVFRSRIPARRVIFSIGLIATAVFGAVHIVSAAGTGFDVLLLHDAAADAIAGGISPYSSAVTVPNGAPVGDPFIVGYPYPPLTALAYSVSDWTLGDPRWTSLVGWLVVLAVTGAKTLRADRGENSLGIMLMAAAIPGWPLVLTTGWTESFSLMLLALAITAWARPDVSGAMSGLFLGSKQYLLAGAPVYVANRLREKWRRALWAAAALAIAFVPVLIWGIPEFVDAAVRFHLQAPARSDGSSIVGLLDLVGVGWEPPLWIMVLVVVGLAVVLRRHIDSRERWLAGLGVLLSVALFLSSQAFTNYWFLMAGIAALAAATGAPIRSSDQTSVEGSARETL